jgi:hypothetical protein
MQERLPTGVGSIRFAGSKIKITSLQERSIRGNFASPQSRKKKVCSLAQSWLVTIGPTMGASARHSSLPKEIFQSVNDHLVDVVGRMGDLQFQGRLVIDCMISNSEAEFGFSLRDFSDVTET